MVGRDGSFQFLDRMGKIAAVEINAAEDILGAGVSRVFRHDRLRELASLVDITGTEATTAASTLI